MNPEAKCETHVGLAATHPAASLPGEYRGGKSALSLTPAARDGHPEDHIAT